MTASETADRDRQDKERADKLKLDDDRHRQNADTLANLQKALVRAIHA